MQRWQFKGNDGLTRLSPLAAPTVVSGAETVFLFDSPV